MKRFLTLCAVMTFVLALGGTAQAASWDVPGDFATIQAAMDSALVIDGDRIMVGAGNHAGAIVTKAVEIKGGGGATIDSGPLLAPHMPCGTIVLNIGFFFPGGGTGSGATISHLNFEGVAFPVFSRGADNVTVTQGTMSDPVQGVTNWSGNSWEVSHNQITDLRSANGGGIGIIVADSSGGVVKDNVISHNKLAGTLHVAACDGGGYAGSGIVLFADWRYGRSGAENISDNRIVKNKVGLVSDGPDIVDVNAMELTEALNPGGIVIKDNAVGFNDFRGTASQVVLSPAGLDNPVNKISRNLGENRGHGLHPSVFGPDGD